MIFAEFLLVVLAVVAIFLGGKWIDYRERVDRARRSEAEADPGTDRGA